MTAILLHGRFQRQDAALVLQQNDRFPRRLARELPMRRGIVLRVRDLRVRDALWRIEHAQPEARHEEPLGGTVDLGFRDGAGLHLVDQARYSPPHVRSVPALTAATEAAPCVATYL